MIYKILFWSLTTGILIFLLIKYSNYIGFLCQLAFIYIVCRPQYMYQVWYIKRHGWTPYFYASEAEDTKGQLFEHPEMWVHKNYKSTRYSNKDGAYPMWSAWQISRGKEDANGKTIKK